MEEPTPPTLNRPELEPRRRGAHGVYWVLLGAAIAALVGLKLSAWSSDRPTSGRELADDWFHRHRERCNSLDIGLLLQRNPPADPAQRAACLALAGKIDAARDAIRALARPADQINAAEYVFSIGHPIADAGDDASAGPIMELVVEFEPDQYMALYHAGMAQAIAGNDDRARRHLERFLEIYRATDGWTSNARRALASLDRARGDRTVQRGAEGSIVY